MGVPLTNVFVVLEEKVYLAAIIYNFMGEPSMPRLIDTFIECLRHSVFYRHRSLKSIDWLFVFFTL